MSNFQENYKSSLPNRVPAKNNNSFQIELKEIQHSSQGFLERLSAQIEGKHYIGWLSQKEVNIQMAAAQAKAQLFL